MWALSSLHTSNVRRRVAFDLRHAEDASQQPRQDGSGAGHPTPSQGVRGCPQSRACEACFLESQSSERFSHTSSQLR